MPDPISNPASGAAAAAAPALAPAEKHKRPELSNAARTMWPTFVMAAIVAGIIAVNWYLSLTHPVRAWVLTMFLLAALFLFLGTVISRRPLGILVGSRNLMSLSRFQIVAWSLVILSAFLTIAFRRALGGADKPLDIAMDPYLWALMGISTASLVGTPLILQNKASQKADDSQVKAAGEALGEDANAIKQNSDGKLYANPDIWDARVTDMFEGDEVGNTAYIDIAKVQMFMFTMISIVVYCFVIYSSIGGNAKTLALPALSQGMIALLGISHAGYLGSKTADHTPTPPKG